MSAGGGPPRRQIWNARPAACSVWEGNRPRAGQRSTGWFVLAMFRLWICKLDGVFAAFSVVHLHKLPISLFFFMQISIVFTSFDGSLNALSITFWTQLDPVKRSAANSLKPAVVTAARTPARFYFVNLRPNYSPYHHGLKSEFVDLFKIYRLMCISIKFVENWHI